MERVLDALYSQETRFGESDFSDMLSVVSQRLSKRSLLVVYTNLTSLQAMERQLPYLLQLNMRHRLLLVFFVDNEKTDFLRRKPKTTEQYYQHVITEKMVNEQLLIVSKLRQRGIISLLTTPERLSINVLNKYLELKEQQAI